MAQARIQRWIKRIPIHVKKVINLEGRNEYKEGHRGKRRNSQRVH
jgi:hypothetical protein